MERLTMCEVIEHCKRKVQKVETMFRKEHLESDNCGVADLIQKEYWEHRQVAEWLEQLKAYRDAEEQGLLLRLPCPIGSTIWKFEYPTIYDENGDGWTIIDKKRATVAPLKFALCHLDSIGKLYYLTREEAETKLAEMQKG